jgi:hypothetical protein
MCRNPSDKGLAASAALTRSALVGVTLLLACAAASLAEEYPSRLIRAYMGFPAGTYLDIVTRHFTDRLAQLGGKARMRYPVRGPRGHVSKPSDPFRDELEASKAKRRGAVWLEAVGYGWPAGLKFLLAVRD